MALSPEYGSAGWWDNCAWGTQNAPCNGVICLPVDKPLPLSSSSQGETLTQALLVKQNHSYQNLKRLPCGHCLTVCGNKADFRLCLYRKELTLANFAMLCMKPCAPFKLPGNLIYHTSFGFLFFFLSPQLRFKCLNSGNIRALHKFYGEFDTCGYQISAKPGLLAHSPQDNCMEVVHPHTKRQWQQVFQWISNSPCPTQPSDWNSVLWAV